MWKYEYRQNADVDAKKIWELYSDVKKWPSWDSEMDSVTLYGDFQDGTKGKVKNSDKTITAFSLWDVKPEKGYTMVTQIPELGLEVAFGHSIVPYDVGYYTLVHTLEISGENDEIIGGQVGPALAENFAPVAAKLIAAAGGTIL